MPVFPKWWSWELSFTERARLRMEQRGVTEIDVRAMLERATAIDRSTIVDRFVIRARRMRQRWIMVVELDADAELLVVVTVYQVVE